MIAITIKTFWMSLPPRDLTTAFEGSTTLMSRASQDTLKEGLSMRMLQ
ncbi:putative tail tape measure protein [Salmonella phage 41]|nr:putative tail tape measure protein [Salmonella phage 41]